MSDVMPAGLVTTHQKPVALAGVSISGRVVGPVADLEVVQRYVNTEPHPIEAVYLFPLDSGAAVHGFSMRVGDRLAEGRVEEREKAFASYDDAMASGHGAGLLDMERPDVFRASIGNINAGQTVEIRIRYATLVPADGSSIRLRIPLTVAPRYAPAEPAAVGETEAERLNPERWWAVPYGLTLKIDAAWPGGLRAVESPSHPIRIENIGAEMRVSLTRDDAPMDRDLVLLFEPIEPDAAISVVGVDGQGRRHAMVSLRPTLPPAPTERMEVVFLVDCSGSMGGESIAAARRAVAVSLRTLEVGDTFNVVCFGSSHSAWKPRPVTFDAASLAEGTGYVQAMQANLGGTEILGALQSVLATVSDRRRCVVLLTDGQVTNEDEVIALAQAHAGTTRIFSFGIGTGVSEHLVRGVARVTRGSCELIHPGERIEPKVIRQLGRVRTPLFDDVRVDWNGLDVEMAPGVCPPVFAGDRLVLFGRIRSGVGGSVTLHAGGRAHSAAFDLERPEKAGAIPVLWAHARIRDLEDGTVLRRGSAQARRSDRNPAEIQRLALEYALASSETSWVAVDVRTGLEATMAPAELRRVPLAMPAGSGGGPAIRSAAPSGRSAVITGAGFAPPPPAAYAPQSAPAPAKAGAYRDRAKAAPQEPGFLSRLFRSREAPQSEASGYEVGSPSPAFDEMREVYNVDESNNRGPAGAPPSVPDLYDLLLTQQADGRFVDSPVLRSLTGGVLPATLDAVFATALVVRVLQQRFGGRSNEWRAAGEKARRWLAAQTAPTPSEAELVQWMG